MEGDEPLPRPPPKKMRYSKADDVLLARYFYTKPDGTSDKVFQDFGRLVSDFPRLSRSNKLIKLLCSNPIIPGKDGKNITGYIRPRLITLLRNSKLTRVSMRRRKRKSSSRESIL